METVRKRSSGISSNGLRTWGMFFLLAGMLGKSILQNGLLNLGAVSFGQLLEQMQTSRAAMLYATLALLLQAMETCAVPHLSARCPEPKGFGLFVFPPSA